MLTGIYTAERNLIVEISLKKWDTFRDIGIYENHHIWPTNMRRSASRLNIYRGCPNFFWVNFWECSGWFADLWLMRIYWLIWACHVVCEACPWQGSPWCTSQCEKTRRSGTFRSWQQEIFFSLGLHLWPFFDPLTGHGHWSMVVHIPKFPKRSFLFSFGI